MKLSMRRTMLCVAAAAALGAACARQSELTPPDVRYGQVECDACKMIVSEERFAAALVFADGKRVRSAVFDDIGCLRTRLQEAPPASRARAFVHDHATSVWMDAAQAVFVECESLQTPMGTHLAACASESAAQALLARHPGNVVTLPALAASYDSATTSEGSTP